LLLLLCLLGDRIKRRRRFFGGDGGGGFSFRFAAAASGLYFLFCLHRLLFGGLRCTQYIRTGTWGFVGGGAFYNFEEQRFSNRRRHKEESF
jgi:hypothetical protein